MLLSLLKRSPPSFLLVVLLLLALGVPSLGQAGTVYDVADFNQNGTVDAADYTIWRDNLGSQPATNSEGDADGDNDVDEDDLLTWQSHFGNVSQAGMTLEDLQHVVGHLVDNSQVTTPQVVDISVNSNNQFQTFALAHGGSVISLNGNNITLTEWSLNQPAESDVVWDRYVHIGGEAPLAVTPGTVDGGLSSPQLHVMTDLQPDEFVDGFADPDAVGNPDISLQEGADGNTLSVMFMVDSLPGISDVPFEIQLDIMIDQNTFTGEKAVLIDNNDLLRDYINDAAASAAANGIPEPSALATSIAAALLVLLGPGYRGDGDNDGLTPSTLTSAWLPKWRLPLSARSRQRSFSLRYDRLISQNAAAARTLPFLRLGRVRVLPTRHPKSPVLLRVTGQPKRHRHSSQWPCSA